MKNIEDIKKDFPTAAETISAMNLKLVKEKWRPLQTILDRIEKNLICGETYYDGILDTEVKDFLTEKGYNVFETKQTIDMCVRPRIVTVIRWKKS